MAVLRAVMCALVVACCLLAAACSGVVSGHGRAIAPHRAGPPVTSPPVTSPPVTSPSAPPTQQPSVPSGVPTPVEEDFRCPSITYLVAHLKFHCIVASMRRAQDSVWPLSLGHRLGPHWNVSMGAGHYGAQNGRSLRQITELVRAEMMHADEYGPGARAVTVSAHPRRIARHRGFLLESAMHISAATRSQLHVKVHVERQWIAAVQIGRHDFSMWFVSVPDTAKQLWPKMPAALASIRVS